MSMEPVGDPAPDPVPSHTVHIPEGGFLAIVMKGGRLDPIASDKIIMKMEAKTGMKAFIFEGDFEFYGIGPEPTKKGQVETKEQIELINRSRLSVDEARQ